MYPPLIQDKVKVVEEPVPPIEEIPLEEDPYLQAFEEPAPPIEEPPLPVIEDELPKLEAPEITPPAPPTIDIDFSIYLVLIGVLLILWLISR